MKILSILAVLCLWHYTAFAQNKTDSVQTILLDSKGKIQVSSIPEMSVMIPGDSVTIPDRLKSSRLTKGIEQLHDSLKSYKTIESYYELLPTEYINEFGQWLRSTFREANWKDSLYNSIKPIIYKPLSDIAFKKGSIVLTHEGKTPFLPVREKQGEGIQSEIEFNSSVQNGYLIFSKTVKREQLDNQIIASHLDETRKYYKGWPASYDIVLKSLAETVIKSAPRINALLSADSLRYFYTMKKEEVKFIPDTLCASCPQKKDSSVFNIEVANELVKIYDSFAVIRSFYDKVMTENCVWIKSWLWYTGGDITLNPFIIADPALIKYKVEQDITLLEQKLKVLQAYIDCCKEEKLGYDKALSDHELFTNELNKLRERKEILISLESSYKKWLAAHSVKSKAIYKYTWVTSKPASINWMHHYDAADRFRFRTSKSQLPTMVAEMDQVAVLVHNVPAGDTITLQTLEVPFEPKSKFNETIEQLAGGIATAVKSVSSLQAANLLTNAGPYWTKPRLRTSRTIPPTAHSFTIKYDSMKINKAVYVKKLHDSFKVDHYLIYSQLVAEYMQCQYQLHWLLSQTKPPLSIDLEDDLTPAFRTELLFPTDTLNSSKKVTYEGYINGRKKPDFKSTFKKYLLDQWIPAVGIAYVPGNRAASVFNDTTGTFRSGTDFDSFEILAGVKWYPWQTNTARDQATSKLIRNKFGVKAGILPGDKLGKKISKVVHTTLRQANTLRGNSFLNTFFVTGGLGVRHQFLRNYYLGAGSDITPGLSWQAGANFIFPKRYELQNGSIQNQYERLKPFLFIGVSIDPSVVTSLVKLF